MATNSSKPIYTETAQCQDCYKCLRQCSVKAIKIENGHAMIMPDLCVACGHCVETCPVGAKRVRNDLDRMRRLLLEKKQVIVSLAPSYISEFDDIGPARLTAALRRLGFSGISETALGAQEVSAHAAQMLNTSDTGIHISSACPTAVELIKKYYPRCAGFVTSMLSPVLAHCRLLRRQYGPDIGIVFVGPCIAKKIEADQHPELLDGAITFEELRLWWEQAGIDPAKMPASADAGFIPERAQEGALYPVDGGMAAGIKANCTVHDARFMVFSGIANIGEALKDIDLMEIRAPLFIEVLACTGGCVNGPKARRAKSTVRKRQEIINYAPYPAGVIPRMPSIEIEASWAIAPVIEPPCSDADMRSALKRVGKVSPQDELNCGSCGYDSCRGFAAALRGGRAEPSMCAGYMRKLAGKKADALIRTMPAGIVIVDSTMRIIECNRRFAELLGADALALYEAGGGLDGVELRKISSIHWLFRRALSQQMESVETDVKLRDSVLHATVFTIEQEQLAGGIFQDITAPAVQKERIITKAKEVIAKNIATVQQIAYLLGENAADSEVILNSIVSSFAPESIEPQDKHDR